MIEEYHKPSEKKTRYILSNPHGPHFKGFRVSTQCDPLYPTIFNVIIDTFLRYWVTVVVLEDTRPDGFGWEEQNMTARFCAADNLLASTRAESLQQVFVTLMAIFYRMGLCTNAIKTVDII